MKLDKANKRDKKIQKKKNGMRVSGKSVFVIQEIVQKKANEARNETN